MALYFYKNYLIKIENLKIVQTLRNAPKERQAQLLAATNFYKNRDILNASLAEGEKLSQEDIKKLRAQALNDARDAVGASGGSIKITPKEWEAISSNAISNNTLLTMLKYTDIDQLREYSMPKPVVKLPSAKLSRAVLLLNKGYTHAEVADAIGVSLSTLDAGLESANKEAKRKALDAGDDEDS